VSLLGIAGGRTLESVTLVNGLVRIAIFWLHRAPSFGCRGGRLRNLPLSRLLSFFAFEFLAARSCGTSRCWFRDPLSARQLVSWFLGRSR